MEGERFQHKWNGDMSVVCLADWRTAKSPTHAALSICEIKWTFFLVRGQFPFNFQHIPTMKRAGIWITISKSLWIQFRDFTGVEHFFAFSFCFSFSPIAAMWQLLSARSHTQRVIQFIKFMTFRKNYLNSFQD